ncbi:MAG: hypothetical protein HY721_09825, partial [Planctomycetes bacterium]|nr:hypothetical protein [Planctomycetota bacterium]
FPGMTPTILTRATSFRQPVVGSFDGSAWDADFDFDGTNAYNPIYPDTKMFEDILLGLASALGFTQDLGGTALPANAWAHVKAGVTNLKNAVNAASDPGKPGAGSLTEDDIVARGGAFQDPGYAYNGTKLRYTYSNEIKLYYEPLATTVDSMSSSGAAYAPVTSSPAVARYEAVKDIRGNAVTDLSYPFQLITYKMVLHGQARTQNLPWLTVWQPENFIELNAADAGALGLRTGDRARVSSASNPTGLVGRVKTTEGLRPGVVAISHHFGHWQQSSSAWYENGTAQSYDSSRSLGIQPNLIMRLDPVLGDVTLQDKIGASSSFNDTRVKVEKA